MYSLKKRSNNRSKNQPADVEKRIKYLLYYSSLKHKAVHLGAISKKSRRGWRRGNVRLITNSVENSPFSPSVFLLERLQFPPFPALVSILPSFLRFFSGSSLTITSWLLFSSHHRRYHFFLFYVVSVRSLLYFTRVQKKHRKRSVVNAIGRSHRRYFMCSPNELFYVLTTNIRKARD